MSKTIKRMEKFLDEGVASGLERFDVPKPIILDLQGIGKDLQLLAKKAKKISASKVLSGLRDYEDEIHELAQDLEDHLGGL
jgi:hypothetical protein